MKKYGVYLLMIVSFAVLAACAGESLEGDVRLMPEEDVSYVYEYTAASGEVSEQEERHENRIGDIHVVTDANGEVVSAYKETTEGFFEYDAGELSTKAPEKLTEASFDELKAEKFMEYPITEQDDVSRNDGATYTVTAIDESLETPYKKFEEVVRVDVGYSSSDYAFTYFFKEDIGIVGIAFDNGTSLLKEVNKD